MMIIKPFSKSKLFLAIYISLTTLLLAVSLSLFCDSGCISDVTEATAEPIPEESIYVDSFCNGGNCFIPMKGISFENVRYIRTIPGGTYKIQVTKNPVNSNETIYWRSLNPSVAVIDDDGTINALSKGESVIIAENYDRSVRQTTIVMVRDMPPAMIDAPYINQLRDFPNGCESCSTVMALNHAGIDITTEEFIENYLDMSPLPHVNENGKYVGASPWEFFLGDPRLSTGLCCYAPAIGNALEKFIDPEEYKVTEHYEVPLEDLCRDYITKNIPIIFWGTMYMETPYLMDWTWQIDGGEEGETFTWVAPIHCLLLVGFDDEYYYFNDPVAGKKVAYTKADTEAAYEGLYKQAITIEPVK